MHFKKDNSPTDSPWTPTPKSSWMFFLPNKLEMNNLYYNDFFFNELLIQNNTRQRKGRGCKGVHLNVLQESAPIHCWSRIWWILWMLLVYDKDKTESLNVDNVHTTNNFGPSHVWFSWCWRCWYFVFIFVEGGEGHNLVFHVNYVFIAPFML